MINDMNESFVIVVNAHHKKPLGI